MLKNKVAIITGASRGIGAHIARTFSENGAYVIGVSRTSIQSHYVHEKFSVNVGDYTAVNQLFHELKQKELVADILINCAGTSKDAYFARLTEQSIREVISVNLEGTIYMSRAFTKVAMTRKSMYYVI